MVPMLGGPVGAGMCAGRLKRCTQLSGLMPQAARLCVSCRSLPLKMRRCCSGATPDTSAILALSTLTLTLGESTSTLCSWPYCHIAGT